MEEEKEERAVLCSISCSCPSPWNQRKDNCTEFVYMVRMVINTNLHLIVSNVPSTSTYLLLVSKSRPNGLAKTMWTLGQSVQKYKNVLSYLAITFCSTSSAKKEHNKVRDRTARREGEGGRKRD
jgi:hypothetical protein